MNKTALLVKKDFIYLFTSLKRLIVFSILVALLPLGNITLAFAVPPTIAYLLTYGIFAYEEKNKTHFLNAALPVDRKAFCSSRYITSMIYILVGSMLTGIGAVIGPTLQNSYSIPEMTVPFDVTVKMMMIVFAGALIYHAFILPGILYFGALKVRYIMLAVYIITFILLGSLGSARLDRAQVLTQNFSDWSGILLILVSVLIYFISYLISISLYTNKDIK